jgi:hypothetical protein
MRTLQLQTLRIAGQWLHEFQDEAQMLQIGIRSCRESSPEAVIGLLFGCLPPIQLRCECDVHQLIRH